MIVVIVVVIADGSGVVDSGGHPHRTSARASTGTGSRHPLHWRAPRPRGHIFRVKGQGGQVG